MWVSPAWLHARVPSASWRSSTRETLPGASPEPGHCSQTWSQRYRYDLKSHFLRSWGPRYSARQAGALQETVPGSSNLSLFLKTRLVFHGREHHAVETGLAEGLLLQCDSCEQHWSGSAEAAVPTRKMIRKCSLWLTIFLTPKHCEENQRNSDQAPGRILWSYSLT